MKCLVELYGMTDGVVGKRDLGVELDDGVRLRDLVAALRASEPALEGRVIQAGEDRLTRHYVFNVNGRFYVDEYDLELRSEDRAILLTFALGG